jgi:hypothetical protein
MQDIINVYPTPVLDEYGKSSFASSTAYKGRFVEKTKVILSPTGENVTSQAEVWLTPDVPVDLGDKLIYETQGYRIIQLSKPKTASTVKFIKCYLERYEG